MKKYTGVRRGFGDVSLIVLGTEFLLGAMFVVRSLPDLRRYLRMRSM